MVNRLFPPILILQPWMQTISSIQPSHLTSAGPIRGQGQRAHRVVFVTAQRQGKEAVTHCAAVEDLQNTLWNMKKTVCVNFTGAVWFSAKDVL